MHATNAALLLCALMSDLIAAQEPQPFTYWFRAQLRLEQSAVDSIRASFDESLGALAQRIVEDAYVLEDAVLNQTFRQVLWSGDLAALVWSAPITGELLTVVEYGDVAQYMSQRPDNHASNGMAASTDCPRTTEWTLKPKSEIIPVGDLGDPCAYGFSIAVTQRTADHRVLNCMVMAFTAAKRPLPAHTEAGRVGAFEEAVATCMDAQPRLRSAAAVGPIDLTKLAVCLKDTYIYTEVHNWTGWDDTPRAYIEDLALRGAAVIPSYGREADAAPNYGLYMPAGHIVFQSEEVPMAPGQPQLILHLAAVINTIRTPEPPFDRAAWEAFKNSLEPPAGAED